MTLGWGPKGREFKSRRPDLAEARFESGLSAFRAVDSKSREALVVPLVVPNELLIDLGRIEDPRLLLFPFMGNGHLVRLLRDHLGDRKDPLPSDCVVDEIVAPADVDGLVSVAK